MKSPWSNRRELGMHSGAQIANLRRATMSERQTKAAYTGLAATDFVAGIVSLTTSCFSR